MAFQRRAAPTSEQPEPLVEMSGDLGRAQRHDAGGGQLDGQWNAVEPPTDLGDRLGVGRFEAQL